MLRIVEETKAQWIDHAGLMRQNNFINIFEGKILGKRPIGRPRASFFFLSIMDSMDCGPYGGVKINPMVRETLLKRQGIAFTEYKSYYDQLYT